MIAAQIAARLGRTGSLTRLAEAIFSVDDIRITYDGPYTYYRFKDDSCLVVWYDDEHGYVWAALPFAMALGGKRE